MSELPKGWVKCTIGDSIFLNEKHIGLMDEMECGFVPMTLVPTSYGEPVGYEVRTWGQCKKGFTQFRDNDVILAKITPCFENGKGALVTGLPNGIGAGSTEYFVLRTVENLVVPKYVHAFVKTKDFLVNCETNMSGSVGHRRVPKDYLLNYPFSLAPLAEQKRIVAKLDEVLAQVDIIKARLDRIPAILKRFRQSVLAAAVSGKLTEEWREDKIFDLDKEISQIDKNRIELYLKDNAEHFEKTGKSIRKYDYSTLKEDPEYRVIPNSWKLVQLGEIISFLTDYHANGSYEVLKEHVELKETEDYACMIRATNFEKNNFEDLFVFISKDAYEFLSKSKLYGNEILVGKIGNAGSVYLMPQLGRPASLAMNLFALRFDESLVSPEYVYMFLKSSIGEKNIQKYVRGVATKSIDKKSLRSVFINYPPREEQTEIVRLVDQYFAFADTIEAQVKKAQARVDNLTQSILAKAFRGELVAQDPNDEPAEKLLERIAQARIEAEALAKTAKKVGSKGKATS